MDQLTFDDMAPSLDARVALADAPQENLTYHPLAGLFPLLDGEAFDTLVADIRTHGVLEPIWLYHGQLLDGRNRYRACRQLGIPCPSRIYDGADPLEFVLSLNLRRRHLDESQRAMIAAKLANMRQGERTDLEPSANLQKVSMKQASTMLNVSEQTTHQARKVHEHGAPELVQAVVNGVLPVSVASRLATLPVEEQAALAEQGPQALRQAAKASRQGPKPAPAKQPLHVRYANDILRGLLALTRQFGVEPVVPDPLPEDAHMLEMITTHCEGVVAKVARLEGALEHLTQLTSAQAVRVPVGTKPRSPKHRDAAPGGARLHGPGELAARVWDAALQQQQFTAESLAKHLGHENKHVWQVLSKMVKAGTLCKQEKVYRVVTPPEEG